MTPERVEMFEGRLYASEGEEVHAGARAGKVIYGPRRKK
jgi:hypothetical protein